MKSIPFRILIITAIGLFYSCSSDSDDPTIIDTGSDFTTYNANVKSILSSNCTGCHANPPINDAPFSLTTYNDVKNNASLILSAISKETGEVGAMPPSGKLSQSTIDVISQWIEDGLLEN